MAKRAYQTGSWRRLSPEKVRLEVSGGTGMGGKRQRPSKVVVAKTDAAAERALAAFVAEVAGRGSGENMTLNALLDEYMELHVDGLAAQTKRWYTDTLKRARSALGSVKLRDLTPLKLNKWYKQLERDGLAAATVQHHHRAVGAALRWAYRMGVIGAPISDRATPPTKRKAEKRALDGAERAKFLVALDAEAARCAKALADVNRDAQAAGWMLLGRVALVMGLRRGELCGLQWADIEGGRMHVCHNVQLIKGQGLVCSDTKTLSSDRRLEIPAQIQARLKELRALQAAHGLRYGLGQSKYVFTTLEGGPREPAHVSKWVKRALKRAGAADASLHTLRHTCCTFLLAAGMAPNDVSAYMGHSSTQMTLDVYGHAQQERAAACAAAAARMLGE